MATLESIVPQSSKVRTAVRVMALVRCMWSARCAERPTQTVYHHGTRPVPVCDACRETAVSYPSFRAQPGACCCTFCRRAA